MKYLILLLVLTSCHDPLAPEAEKTQVAVGVDKFQDGDIVCYTYYDNAISCLHKEQK